MSYFEDTTPEKREEILQGYRDLRDGKLDTIARQTALNHASEEETSMMMATFPKRVRPITMEEYDRTGLDYASNLSPEVETYLKPYTKEGWPKGGPNPENPRDRARQENALLATPEKGQALLDIYVDSVAARLQKMIAATD